MYKYSLLPMIYLLGCAKQPVSTTPTPSEVPSISTETDDCPEGVKTDATYQTSPSLRSHYESTRRLNMYRRVRSV